MLDAAAFADDLKKDFQNSLSNEVLDQALSNLFPEPNSSKGKEKRDNCVAVLREAIDLMAENIADRVDQYINKMEISGTLMATGAPISPVYTAQVIPVPAGSVTAGKVPMTLGIK